MGANVQIQIFDTGVQDGAAFNIPVDMFGKNFDSMVEEEGSIFPVSKHEAVRVEELYKYGDLGDDVLDLNASDQRMHYNFGEFLTLEYHPTKIYFDVPDSNPSLSDNIEIFCDEISAADTIFPQEKSILSDSSEDYLANNKFLDAASVDASFQVLENMKVNKLHGAFRNMIGHETTVTDKQCIKNRLLLSSHNLLASNNKKSNMVIPTSNQCSIKGCSLHEDVFKFKKKPRLKRCKRKWYGNSMLFFNKTSSEGDEDPKRKSSEKEEDHGPVAIKRSRTPTQRLSEEDMEQKFKYQKEKYGASTTGGLNKQHNNKRIEAKRVICPLESYNGECIQVPFGEPILSQPTKKKAHRPKDWKKDSRLVTSKADTELESLSSESEEDISEDDFNKGKIKNTRKKHHNYWSVSEVENLIKGVSLYGVGRWTEIKKLMFNSPSNRTSVDLKDKWRNLVRASCSTLKNNCEKKHSSKQIPNSILLQVKKLAATNQCQSTHVTRGSEAACVTSAIPNSADGIFLPLSSASIRF